ncbi:MAG: ABC transporter substrate-binding protein [Proteobacteria bacterium]|nr:ABC transporter substrate-binding protein [Pseudomonadota bacterium]
MQKRNIKISERAKGVKPVDTHPVGTGRFMLEEGSPGNYLKLKRNPNWWFGKAIGRPEMPYPDGLKIVVIPDDSIKLANLRAGKIDSLTLSSMATYSLIKSDPNFKVGVRPYNDIISLRFNTVKGPCRDIRVRKAISHAIDRRALVHGIRFGQAIVAHGNFTPTHWCHNPELEPVEFNPELSRKLLVEAGYTDDLTIKGFMGNLSESVAVATAIKGMLAKVGIDWQVVHLDSAARSDYLDKLKFDLASSGMSIVEDPHPVVHTFYHPDGTSYHGRSSNEKTIGLIEAGLKELDMEKRQKIYWELERLLYENHEDVWLWHSNEIIARSKRWKGYDVDLHNSGNAVYGFFQPRWLEGGKR